MVGILIWGIFLIVFAFAVNVVPAIIDEVDLRRREKNMMQNGGNE